MAAQFTLSTCAASGCLNENIAKSGPRLFTHGGMHGLSFGVLRRRFREHDNDAATFVAKKLRPCDGNDGDELIRHLLADGPTAARWDILLPPGAPDVLGSPLTMAQHYMVCLPPHRQDILLHLKLTVELTQALHESWERARSFAHHVLALEHSLPVVLVMHDPRVQASANPHPPHIHLMAFARALRRHGWCETTHLARDDGHPLLASAWQATG